jgi:hypothetical protein
MVVEGRYSGNGGYRVKSDTAQAVRQVGCCSDKAAAYIRQLLQNKTDRAFDAHQLL